MLERFFAYISNVHPPLINMRFKQIAHYGAGNHINLRFQIFLLLDFNPSYSNLHCVGSKIRFLHSLRNSQQLGICEINSQKIIPISIGTFSRQFSSIQTSIGPDLTRKNLFSFFSILLMKKKTKKK